MKKNHKNKIIEFIFLFNLLLFVRISELIYVYIIYIIEKIYVTILKKFFYYFIKCFL